VRGAPLLLLACRCRLPLQAARMSWLSSVVMCGLCPHHCACVHAPISAVRPPPPAAAGSLEILIYSGDVDAIVPVIGSRRWVSGLKRKVLAPWKAWVSSTQQVGPPVRPTACLSVCLSAGPLECPCVSATMQAQGGPRFSASIYMSDTESRLSAWVPIHCKGFIDPELTCVCAPLCSLMQYSAAVHGSTPAASAASTLFPAWAQPAAQHPT
jgi:hypothetical protein